jgi:hypothetical protein
MRYLSVCAGIEAATVAWHPLGWEPAAFSEIDPFARAVLAHHYPLVPLHGDFTTIRAEDFGAIDLLVGGTPCQSFSVAGLGTRHERLARAAKPALLHARQQAESRIQDAGDRGNGNRAHEHAVGLRAVRVRRSRLAHRTQNAVARTATDHREVLMTVSYAITLFLDGCAEYAPDGTMIWIESGSDHLLLTTMWEGFGLVIGRAARISGELMIDDQEGRIYNLGQDMGQRMAIGLGLRLAGHRDRDAATAAGVSVRPERWSAPNGGITWRTEIYPSMKFEYYRRALISSKSVPVHER